MWEIIAGQALSAGLGAWGANQAANAQQDAAKRQADTAYRNTLAQLQLQEPQRFTGYQALSDLNSLYGYQTSPYATIGQLQNTMTKLGAGEVKQALKGGMSFDQLSQMGTLGDVSGKQLKKLGKYLTPEQIMQLRAGPQAASVPSGAPAQPGPTSQPGNMDRFFASPDYQFRQQEGAKAIDRAAAARGQSLGGNALRAQTQYASNLASGEYGNYMNRLMQMAGLGTAATNAAGNAVGAGNAALMQTQGAQGDARASGIMGGVNSASNAINSGLSLYALSKYLTPNPMEGLSPINITAKRI